MVNLHRIKLKALAASIAALCLFGQLTAYAAPDTSGIHAFFNDDRNQFVDFWLNTNGQVTVKVSNGLPWRPMWVVLHANFISGDQVIGRKDYHVFAPSPNPGGGGAERWFHFGNPGFAGVTAITVSTNKEAPWGNPEPGWEPEITISVPSP
ncbi:hypothetical protein FJW04_05955 [Mesorhizobium sp. B2-7-3]|uniref:hypothetical protein n=1 Tax=Mesorhizobium sp. B2-7-3 TaxID=2589907 RepID=UPI001126F953|nr:hypothetical protein [Mesorhizobium sp. B2-7-3]TPJ18858.1 hypothetical protein FJW04_05955 [Mesorhizobium sp. B2-7-3]